MRVRVCIPSRGEWKAGFGLDVARLVAHTLRVRPDIQLGFVTGSGTLLHDIRNMIARDATSDGAADYLFWLDDDVRFPDDALLRLLAHGKDLVGAQYVTKSIPPRATAKVLTEDGLDYYDFPSGPNDTGLAKVDVLPFGCALVKAHVFASLPTPWFSMPWSPRHNCHVGEDTYFCTAAGAAGFTPFVDHDLSRCLKHVGPVEYEWKHYDATHG